MKTFNIEHEESFDIIGLLHNNENSNHNMRTMLIRLISSNMLSKRYEIALKLCESYNQKFSETIFLNSNIFIILAEIYYELDGIETAQFFFDKSKYLIKWQYQEDNPFLIDILYSFSSILMKNLKENEKKLEDILKELMRLCLKVII